MVERIPVQPIVMILALSISPTVTITGGSGAVSAPALKFFLAILFLFSLTGEHTEPYLSKDTVGHELE